MTRINPAHRRPGEQRIPPTVVHLTCGNNNLCQPEAPVLEREHDDVGQGWTSDQRETHLL